MMYPRKEIWLSLAVCFAVGVMGFAGCAGEAKPAPAKVSKFRPADDVQAEPAATEATAVVGLPAAETPVAIGQTGFADPVAVTGAGQAADKGNAKPAKAAAANAKVPTGDVKELVALIDRLAKQAPKGANQQEQLQDFVQTQQQRLAACQKVLAMNPDAATKARIVDAMFEIFQLYGRLGVPGGRHQLIALAKSLAQDPDPAVATKGRQALFGANVSQLAGQPLADGKRIIEEVNTLLEGEKVALSPESLDLAGQAAEILMQNGLKDDAVAVYELLATAAGADPKLADRAKRYADRSKMAKIDLETLLTNILTDKPDAEAKLVEAVKALLAETEPSRELFSNLQQVVMIMEATGHLEAAKGCFDQLEVAFKDVKDEALKGAVTRSLEGARKRMALVGQPFVVEGVMLDGKPFDWAAYQGKVVLIDFWATWCGPCLEELPNIRSNFEQFHALGFDVVGINLNTEISDVKQFFAVQELPWTSVTSQVVLDGKANEDWTQLPMAAKCGVDAIPLLVLVGKDGKVDSLHVRGPKLRTRLTALLGEPPAVATPADPTVPKAKAADEKKSGAVAPRGAVSPVALLMAQALFAADEPAKASAEVEANSYLPKPGLESKDLIVFIEKMLDKPKTIQSRAGFAEAIAEACDRVMAAEPPASEAEFLTAAESKFFVLHREACLGKQAADEQVMAFVEKLKDDRRPRIAQEVEFFRLERRILDAKEGPIDLIPAWLQEVSDYAGKGKLTGKHLRLASATVALINRLEDGDVREKHFAELGELFAKSSDKQMASYGRKLAKKKAEAETELVGKP